MPLFATGLMLLDIAYVFAITYDVAIVLALIATIVVFIVSLIYCRRRTAPAYMRMLPLYFFLNNLVEVLAFIFRQHGSLYIYGAFIYVDVVYLLYFFFLLFGPARRIYYWWALLIVVIPSLVLYFFTGNIMGASSLAAILESIVLVIPSVIYYRELFQRPKITALEKDASFWMVSGIFFYYFIRLPVVWFTGYYYQINSESFSMGVYSINNYAVVISYALYIKGMVCLTR